MTKELKNIIRMVLLTIIVTFSITGIAHAYTFESKIEQTFENGYEQAIKEAVLVESNENGYILSFNGELHAYTFE